MDPITGVLIGSAVTGGLGALGGLFGGSAEASAARKARQDLDKGWEQYKSQMGENLAGLDALIASYGGDTDALKSEILNAYENGKGQYTAGQFTPGDVEQWLDPNVDYRIQRATTALENSAAGRNKLLSGATQKSISDRAQQIAQEAYESARSAGLNAFQANEATKQAEAASGANAINNILSMYNSNLGAKTGLEQSGLQMRQNLADQGMNYAGAKANTRTAKSDDPTSMNFWSQGIQGALQGISPWATSFGTAFGQKKD